MIRIRTLLILAIPLFFVGIVRGYSQITYELRAAEYPDFMYYDIRNDKNSNALLKESGVPYTTILWDGAIIRIIDPMSHGAPWKYRNIGFLKDIRADDDGFLSFEDGHSTYSDGTINQRSLILAGGGWFLQEAYDHPLLSGKFDYYKNISNSVFMMMEQKQKNGSVSPDWGEGSFGFVDDGIWNIAAFSCLNELIKGKTVTYSAENMRHFLVVDTYDYYQLELNSIDPPWAEGVEGAGIGGAIDVEFSRSSKSVIILNGYVDLAKRYLYKQNNRLKTVRIESSDPFFSITSTLEDVVMFHEIPFPAMTKKVRIVILDVYKGSKYDDTCITKIFIRQQELRPRQKYESEIKKALQKSGYLE